MGALRLLAASLLAGCGAAARVRVAPQGVAATGFAADAATRRALLQAQGGSSSETATDMMTQMLLTVHSGNHAEAARASQQLLSMLVLAKLQSAFVVTESILITDATVSLVTVTDKANSTVTIVPGETFWDAAFGEVFQAGVSGLFYIDTQADLMGALPAVGNQITVANIEGKVNVPARRRRLATVEALAASQPALDAPAPPAEQTVHLPRRMTASVSPAQLAALTADGFWERLFTVLPPSLYSNLTTLLQQTSVPLGEYMLRQNVSQAEVDRALAGLHGDNLTITQPIFGPQKGAVTVIPVLDVEFSFTLLDQTNTAGANARITPSATRFQGNGVVFQSVKVVPFLSAYRTVFDQGLTPVGQLVQAAHTHNATLAAQLAKAKEQRFISQSLPFPTLLTLSVDIFIRAQIQINGGDIALVL